MTYIYRVWKTSKRMKYDKQIVTSNISKIIKVFDIHKIKEKTIWWIKWRVWLPEAGQCSLALQALDGSRLLLTPVYKQFIYLFVGDEESRMNTLFLFCSSSYHRKIVINHSKFFLICCFFLPYLLKWIFLFLFNFWYLITFAPIVIHNTIFTNIAFYIPKLPSLIPSPLSPPRPHVPIVPFFYFLFFVQPPPHILAFFFFYFYLSFHLYPPNPPRKLCFFFFSYSIVFHILLIF